MTIRQLIVVSAALALVGSVACGPPSEKRHRHMLGTAGASSELYLWGGGAAQIVSQFSKNVQLTAQLTAGSGENLVRLRSGAMQLAVAANELNLDMFTGGGTLPQYEHRALFAITLGEWHWVARSDFEGSTIYDFKGKRVSFGPKGGASYHLLGFLLDSFGLGFDDFDARYLSVGESVDAMKDRNIDAYVVCIKSPASAFMDLARIPGGIKLISLSPQDIAKARAAYPFLAETVIPPDTYHGVSSPTRGVGRWQFLVSRADLPDEAAYQIAKALTEHHDEFVDIIPAAVQSTPENTIQHAVIPLHPGVEQYFRENGYLN